MHYKICLFSVVSILLSSCMPVAISPVAETRASEAVSSEMSPTQTFSSPSSSLEPANASELTMTPASTPVATLSVVTNTVSGLTVRCPEYQEDLQRPGGLIVLLDYDGSSIDILDLRNGTRFPVSQEVNKKSLPAVSPSGRWLAYVEKGSQPEVTHLRITNSDGISSVTMPWETDWRNIAGWLDDEQLIISKSGLRTSDGLDTLVILNPFTGIQQELPSDFPSIWTVTPKPQWDGFSLAESVYDPSLTYAAYARYSEDLSGEATAVGIWDVRAGQEIARLDGTNFFGRTPKWSATGLKLALANTLSTTLRGSESVGIDQEIFVVSHKGQVAQATQLTMVYDVVKIGSLSWSPSGDYIAFWLEAEPRTYPEYWNSPDSSARQRLAIVGTSSMQVTDYCVPGDKHSGLSADPVWSPDNRYVVTENRINETAGHVFLTDIFMGVTVQIAQDARPIGWMMPLP